MMKGAFQLVHGAVDLIQPHDHYEYTNNSIQYPGLNTGTFQKSLMENTPTLEKNELSMWVENVTKQLIEDLPESGIESPQNNTPSGYENHNILSSLGDLRPNKMLRRSYGDIGEGTSFVEQNNNQANNRGLSKLDENGLSLITLLLECAVAISVDNLGEAHRMLIELAHLASPYGPSCAERIVAYFSKAMASRVINSWLGICTPLINHKNIHSSFQLFNNISPFIKFAHFTSNQAILEAFHRRDKIHIIDLDIMQGLQWPALFHILATRLEGPPHVRMTGMGASMEILVETGKQLSNFAKRLGMEFEFQPITTKFGDATVSMLQIRPGEAISVHWLQHSLYDATGPDWKTIRLLQELSPRVITLVEQDISHGGSFLDRFVAALHYYSTIFDSLGACFSNDDQSRHQVEHSLLHREINNVLAIGGPARSGEDKFKHWRSELGRNGFIQVPMSGNSMAQAQLILNMFPPSHGYSLMQGDGTLRLGWKDTSLFTASVWTTHGSSYR